MAFKGIAFYFLFLFICFCISASGQPLKRLHHSYYNVNEGLLHSQVTDIAEDKNGFLWIASTNGLQKFDGNSFYHVFADKKKGIPDDKHLRLFAQQNDKLWLLHKEGLSQYDIYTDKFQIVFRSQDLNSEKAIYPFLETNDAIWWQSFHKNFYRLDKKSLNLTDSIILPVQNYFQSISIKEANGKSAFILSCSDNKIIVADTYTMGFKSFRCGEQQKKIIGIERYKSDTVIIATSRGIEKFNIHTGEFFFLCPYKSMSPPIATNLNIKLLALANGNYLVNEGKELFELNINQEKYTGKFVDTKNQNFVSIGMISKFYTDHYGNVWLISENDGIRKISFSFSGFRYSGTNDKSKNFVKTIYADKKDNIILCGTMDGGMLIFDTAGRLIKSVNDFPGFVPPYTIAAFQKRSPDNYFVLLSGGWNAYLINTKTFSLKPVLLDTAHASLRFVFDYHLNILPLNDTQNIIQNSHQVFKAQWKYPGTLQLEELAYLPIPTISSYIDNQKQLWVGGRSQYFLFRNPHYASYSAFDLPEKILVRSFCDSKTGLIWMGTERGLYQLDQQGNIKKIFFKSDGLIDENIYSVREDRNGNLWFSHNKGISCMKTNGAFTHFNKDDGLQENEFNTGAVAEAEDGELFFGGVNGVSSFFPEKILQQYHRPVLFITSIRVKDKEWITDTATWQINKINLPWKDGNLSFQFTALGLRKPDQYTYQYRIRETDKTWINNGNNGIARFVLSPGKYTLQFYAGNGFAMDAEPLKEISIVISPPYWKTNWFRGLALMLIISISILITRYTARLKLKKRIEELERKKTLEEERLRISREMHDDIGAGLTRITMLSEAAKGKPRNEEQLNKIADTSRQLVADMSEIIWSMNPEHNTLDQLLAYLREQIRNLLEYSGIRYKIVFPENGMGVVLNNSQRRNLLLIIKELVHNAVKHSKASMVTIIITQKVSSLDFLIADDGGGFDTTASSYGNGMRNIKKRIEELSGKLNIQSSSTGTTVSGTVPL